MLNLLYFLLIVSQFLTICVECVGEHEALHFSRNISRFTIDRAMLEETEHPPMLHPTATACPAKSDEENAFNEKYSFGKNSLFVRNTYEEYITSSAVDYYICENPYKLSILYHNEDVEFQFGFEIYYDKSKYGDKDFVETKRGDYDLITNTYAYINYIKPFFSYIPIVPLLFQFLQAPLYLDNDRKTEVGFIWIHSFYIKFNFKAKRVAQSTYGLSLKTRGFHKCDNHDLGKEFFDDLDIENLYRENNQKKMLEGVKLPTSEDGEKYREMECESENQCFIKWSTIPAEQFHHLATKPTSCSDLSTVPVWKSTIYDVLNRLDNFLFAVSMVIGHPVGDIKVHSGVYGVLQLPTDSDNGQVKPITLAGKAIEVPDIIYKFVKFKTKICQVSKDIVDKYHKSKSLQKSTDIGNEKDELKIPKSEPSGRPGEINTDSKWDESNENTHLLSKKESANENENEESKNPSTGPAVNNEPNEFPECKWSTLGIIVVIHNNPYFNPETDRICKDLCLELGWDLIKYRKLSETKITSKYIYCCRADDTNVRKKLGIKHEDDTEAGIQPSSTVLSLRNVPIYNPNTNEFQLRDVYDLVNKTYKQIFEGVKFVPNEKDIWRLLIPSHHLKMSFFYIEEPGQDKRDEPEDSEMKVEGREEIGKP